MLAPKLARPDTALVQTSSWAEISRKICCVEIIETLLALREKSDWRLHGLAKRDIVRRGVRSRIRQPRRSDTADEQLWYSQGAANVSNWFGKKGSYSETAMMHPRVEIVKRKTQMGERETKWGSGAARSNESRRSRLR